MGATLKDSEGGDSCTMTQSIRKTQAWVKWEVD